jgi:hypothetical protein
VTVGVTSPSLVTPWAQKKQFFNPNDPILCPDANTRLYTD